ncbi:MAG: tyrosine-type recombinase/integrase [Bacteroidetes bacterium]|nr:tyrosine-type recombinase/integrase [Bacteroidota bacterium]
MVKKLTINSYSQSTLSSYGRSIAKVSIDFGKVPLELDNDQIEDYLFVLKQQQNPKSETYFKHTVYGLRYLFRLYDREDRAIQLPQLKREKKLPAVMSKNECRRLFTAANTLKHRVMLALVYSAGLRRSEVINLTPEDIDSDRMQIHIRQSKNRKDRYVVLSEYVLQGLRKYWKAYCPERWLFNGNMPGKKMSFQALRWAMDEAVRRAGIRKHVTLHTLRHSYATHLLEDGVDLYTLKEQLGHEQIENTLIYLHIARTNRKPCHSPLDTLYGQ